MSELLSITLWNVWWASRASDRGSFFIRRLADLSSHVVCITEGHSNILPDSGHIITSVPDYGYPLKPGRRKVLLWSSQFWRDVDILGSPLLPPGRFVAGTTDTPLGPTRFIGVCIPWPYAHVHTGQRNRQPWEDHQTYLQHLRLVLQERDRALPTVLLGDFNQRVPRARQPDHVFSMLTGTLSPDFKFATAGAIAGAPDLSIDHLAVDSFQPVSTDFVSHCDATGNQMSDHFGLRVLLKTLR